MLKKFAQLFRRNTNVKEASKESKAADRSKELIPMNSQDPRPVPTDSEAQDVVKPLPDIPRPIVQRRHRNSVSAEVFGQYHRKEDVIIPFYEKSPERLARLKTILRQSLLFAALEDDDLTRVMGAMQESKFAKGDTIIHQGDEGNCLYVIDVGEIDVFKEQGPDKSRIFLTTMKWGEAFGELALLYASPRAATCIARTDEVLVWSLERSVFSVTVRDAAIKKREMYLDFLKQVPILSTLDAYEISRVCDAVQLIIVTAGSEVLRQGEIGDCFYIVLSGTAVAERHGVMVKDYELHDYFGELALLRDAPRAATIRATSDVLKLLKVDRDSFQRLLGPIDSILRRNAEMYTQVQEQANSGAV